VNPAHYGRLVLNSNELFKIWESRKISVGRQGDKIK